MTVLRVAAIQHDIVWHDRDANFARLGPMIDAAAAGGAGLILLTETFSTGFSFDTPGIGEAEGGPSSSFLRDAATRTGAWIGGSCPEIGPDATADDPRPSNVFVLAGPDGTVHRYRKIHPFSHAGEEQFVRAGTEFVTVEVRGVRLSLFVCYDLRFADEFWALAHDTDAFLVVANWPAKRRLHWSTLLRARAIENQAYVVGRQSRRLGRCPRLLRRQRDHRSARRDPGDRCRRRDDPVRRHRHRPRRLHPRPLPLPPRPPLTPIS